MPPSLARRACVSGNRVRYNCPGVGKFLLLDALKRAYEHSRSVAAAMVVVDAKNELARRFYLRYGFRELPALQNRLFLPMKTIETLIASN